jgi:hypothetical protein
MRRTTQGELWRKCTICIRTSYVAVCIEVTRDARDQRSAWATMDQSYVRTRSTDSVRATMTVKRELSLAAGETATTVLLRSSE